MLRARAVLRRHRAAGSQTTPTGARYQRPHGPPTPRSSSRPAAMAALLILLVAFYWTALLGGEAISLAAAAALLRADGRCKSGSTTLTANWTEKLAREYSSRANPRRDDDDATMGRAGGRGESTAAAVVPIGEVPRLLHRTWKVDVDMDDPDLSALPPRWVKAYRRCSRLHSPRQGWKTMLWTDEDLRDLVAAHYPRFLRMYESYRYPIQRADAGRYFVLHRHGGVYLDLDVSCARYLEPLRAAVSSLPPGAMNRTSAAAVPRTRPLGLSNDVMLASPGHPFLEALIESLPRRKRWYGSPYPTVMFGTGPGFLTLVYASLSEGVRGSVSIIGSELYDGEDRDKRYFRHLEGSTWHGWDAAFVKWAHRWSQHLMMGSAIMLWTTLVLVYILKNRCRCLWRHIHRLLGPNAALCYMTVHEE